MIIQFYAKDQAPRLTYIVNFLLGQILGAEVEFLEQPLDDLHPGKGYIHYGARRLSPFEILLPEHPFLVHQSKPDLSVKMVDELPAFFQTPANKAADLPFDLLSMAFYLVTRYEEYGSEALDQHGRFSAKSSLAYQYQFLQQPLIDQWTDRLYQLLKKQIPGLPPRSKHFHFQPTIDVDFAWAYLHKGWARQAGGLIKDFVGLDWSKLYDRIRVWLSRQKDPFDTFEFLAQQHQLGDLRPIYFMLVGEYGKFDKNNSPDVSAMRLLIEQLSVKTLLGLHPSYASNNNLEILKKEKNKLEEIVKSSINKSRQHFLKLHLPQTYQRLIQAGIKEDYSMGYASEVGFRASTAYPFYWYDLENEKVTDLKVYPFQVMDVTLKNYLALTPLEAVEVCKNLVQTIRKTGGTFISIWHNSSFSPQMGWANWQEVYEKLVALTTEIK